MLPSQPKIFNGREAELYKILQLFRQDTPRIVILGAGGMGKTSLARAVLHHPDIVIKYAESRLFVACDSASNAKELTRLIGAHFGLTKGNISKEIIRYFSNAELSLMVLENFETVWEPSENRTEVEEFLSLLTDIPTLALMVSSGSTKLARN